MAFDERLDTLETLWAVWAALGAGFSDSDWQLPTRLGDWTVRELYAHAAFWPAIFPVLAERVTDAAPTRTAAEQLASFNAPGGAAHAGRDKVAADGRAAAATRTTGEIVTQFAVTGPAAVEAARKRGPVVVDYFGFSVMRLEEAAGIGVLEATVHLLDLQRALGIEPSVPAAALADTLAILAASGSPVAVIEALTGRGSPVVS